MNRATCSMNTREERTIAAVCSLSSPPRRPISAHGPREHAAPFQSPLHAARAQGERARGAHAVDAVLGQLEVVHEALALRVIGLRGAADGALRGANRIGTGLLDLRPRTQAVRHLARARAGG